MAIKSQADVAVIGGGIVGCSIAYRLAASGRTVTLFEQRGLASGASGRNGGNIGKGSNLLAKRGDAVYTLQSANLELVKELPEELDADFELRLPGNFDIAMNEAQWEHLRTTQAMQAAAGMRIELLDATALRQALPVVSPAALGATYSADYGHLWPFKLVHAFADAAKRDGACIHQWTPVLKLQQSGDQITGIATSEGVIEADEIVLATNAYTPLLLRTLPAGAIVPARGQILVTQPMPPYLPTPFSNNFGKEYGRQVPGGPILCGGYRRLDTDEGLGHYEERVSAPVLAGIARCLTTLFPALTNVQVVRCWAGIMGFTADGLPLIGRSQQHRRLTIAAGFNGGGFSWASITGKIVASIVNGDDPGFDISQFHPDRFDDAEIAWTNPFTAGEQQSRRQLESQALPVS